MARSTYISKNLIQSQIDLMLMLDTYESGILILQKLRQLAAEKFNDIIELVEPGSQKDPFPERKRKILQVKP